MPYYINKNVTNLHNEPDDLSEVVTQAIYASAVLLLEEKKSWVKVQTADLFSGWVQKEELISKTSSYPNHSPLLQIHSLWSHLYRVNDMIPHAPLLTLPFEAKLQLASSETTLNERWIQVQLLDDTVAWTQCSDYSINPAPATLEQMLMLSKRFLSLPYKWGGTSSFGFDCSGFVQMLYRQMGLSLPRNSRQQVNAKDVIAISREDVASGDLLFFGKENVDHVGLYLENKQFIHSVGTTSQTPPSIQISGIEEQKWEREFQAARRHKLLSQDLS